MTYQTHSPEETRALGAQLAEQLQPGDVILLLGDMGAGKSELTRGIARGLGIEGYLPSPTFPIMQMYETGRLPLYHFDWYRLESAEELYELSMDEYLYGEGVQPGRRSDPGDLSGDHPDPHGRQRTGDRAAARGRVPRHRRGKAEGDEGKMKLLAIDTSGPVCGVAVLEDGHILYEGAAVNKLPHSVSLMPMVEEALNKCSTDISEIELYAAVVGPGSFTGVRIGVSAVKGMAHGAGKPCVAVDALEALAWGVSLMPDLICPIQDARAGQVYGAAFQPGRVPQRVMEDTAAKLEDYLDQALVAAKPEQKLCFLGDGVERYRTAIEARLGQRAVFAPAQMSYLRPAAVAALAWQNRENAVDYLTLQPHYLRAPQAERARAAKLAAEGKA